jgi:hypothetical protein
VIARIDSLCTSQATPRTPNAALASSIRVVSGPPWYNNPLDPNMPRSLPQLCNRIRILQRDTSPSSYICGQT